jgi:hypothetical protein
MARLTGNRKQRKSNSRVVKSKAKEAKHKTTKIEVIDLTNEESTDEKQDSSTQKRICARKKIVTNRAAKQGKGIDQYYDIDQWIFQRVDC